MTVIPGSLNDITTGWLSECLGQDGLESFRLEPMGAGVGMMSAMSRIELDWKDPDSRPGSVVVKLAADNETNRGVAQQFNLYLKEVCYYRELAPATGRISPTVFASAIDDQQNFFLLMEDVSDYRMGNQVEGATLSEAELCVDVLATLHASFWDKIESVDWLPHMSHSDNASNMATGCEIGWNQLMDYFGDFVPASINTRRDEYLAAITGLQEQLDVSPQTLIHGDFRMDNMLFGEQPGHEPLLVVDFQGPLKGSGIQDLGYLMGHSVQTSVRREHERHLVQRYVDGLASKGVEGYDFERAFEHYRIAILYSWTVAVVIAGTLDPTNERGFGWMSKMVERNGIAIEDLDCLTLL